MMLTLRSVTQGWLLCLLLLTATTQAQLGEGSFNRNSLLPGMGQEQPEFLPVTEAYPFQALVDNDELVLHWDIEPGYYLYQERFRDRKSTRLNSSHVRISYAVFCLKKKK